jgi:hypothetical protein
MGIDVALILSPVGRELVSRQPNTYRFTDEDHVRALIGISGAHPEFRGEAVDQVLRAVCSPSACGAPSMQRGARSAQRRSREGCRGRQGSGRRSEKYLKWALMFD